MPRSLAAHPRALLSLAAFALLSACGGGEPTNPVTPQAVTVTLDVTGQPSVNLGVGADGAPMLQCGTILEVRATGTGSVTWTGAVVRVYIGRERTTPVDSLVFSADDVRDAVGTRTFAAGGAFPIALTLTAGIPFAAEAQFNYTPASPSGASSAAARFTCGPAVAPDVAPPAITALATTPASGLLSVGTPLVVTYTATAPAGVWETVLHISGPCVVDRFVPEHFETAVTRTITLALPPECALGVPIRASATVVDIAAQTGFATQETSVVLGDIEPPVLRPTLAVGGQLVPLANASGTWFAGDTLALFLTATDNRGLAAVVWEVLPYGVKDSVVGGGRLLDSRVKVPIRADWSGPIQLRVQARDVTGLLSAPVTTTPDSIRVRPTVLRPTRIGTVSTTVVALSVNPRRDELYVAMSGTAGIAVMSLATMQVTATIPLPASPRDMDITPSGDSLVLAMYGRPLGVVDLTQPARTLTSLAGPTLDASLGQYVANVRVLANGHALVGVSGITTAGTTLLDVDLRTGTQRVRSDVAVDGVIGTTLIERSLDGTAAAISQNEPWCLRRYDVATDAFTSCARPKVRDWLPALDGRGSRIAIGSDVYDASLTLLPRLDRSFTSANSIIPSVLSADGASLFELYSIPGMLRRSASDGTVLDKTPMPIQQYGPRRVSPDGAYLVLVNNFASPAQVAIVDLR